VMASEVLDDGSHDATRRPLHSPPINNFALSICSTVSIAAIFLMLPHAPLHLTFPLPTFHKQMLLGFSLSHHAATRNTTSCTSLQ